MRVCIVFLAALFVLTGSAIAQSACREARSYPIQRNPRFTIQSVSLPSPSGYQKAKAVLPETVNHVGATVFSLSTLAGSEPSRTVDMMSLATELAKRGRATIVIERKLTWPAIDQSVGTMQATVLCAEQWLSTHAAVRPDDWDFVGPESDVPSFEQLHALGDTTSMTFRWGLPVGGSGENENTETILLDPSVGYLQLRELDSFVLDGLARH